MKIGKDMRKKNQAGGVVKLVASRNNKRLWAMSSAGRALGVASVI